MSLIPFLYLQKLAPSNLWGSSGLTGIQRSSLGPIRAHPCLEFKGMVHNPQIILSVCQKYLMEAEFVGGFAPCLMGLHRKYSKFGIWYNCGMCEECGTHFFFVHQSVSLLSFVNYSEILWALLSHNKAFAVWISVSPSEPWRAFFELQWALFSHGELFWVLVSPFCSKKGWTQWARQFLVSHN